MKDHYGNPVTRWTERNGVIVQESPSPGEWLRQWCAENGYALPQHVQNRLPKPTVPKTVGDEGRKQK